MVKYCAVFERHEKKYLLDKAKYKQLRAFLDSRTISDEFGKSTVCSLYCDTNKFDIIRESIERPKYKEKLRLRSYGTPTPRDTVFMELKKKLNGVVYKRRAPLSLRDAELFLFYGVRPENYSQIMEEIDWFVRRVRPVPKVMISCEREALCAKDDPELRITFDFSMRWRDYGLSLSKGSFGTEIIPAGLVLMEVKARGALPPWLARYLSEQEIYPTSFSKYGVCYKKNLAEIPFCEAENHVG